MQELQELRTYIEQGRYADALVLLGEMDEMSYDDKVNKIGSFLEVFLLHLIKQQAEKRTTRSWDVSIHNSVRQIVFTNKRRRAGGYFLRPEELSEAIDERYENALLTASLEAFGGRYEADDLADLVDEATIKSDALRLILEAQAAKS